MNVNIQEDGLLWLINKACFHARGFALGYNSADGTFVLLGDGKEPWRYASPADSQNAIDEDAKFRAVEDALDRARMENA